MVRLASVFILALGGLAAAAPVRIARRAFTLQEYVPPTCRSHAYHESNLIFSPCSYSAFQISDGTAGDAQAKANAVFVTPFNDVDLATVDSTTLKAVQSMRVAAEAAETGQFNPAISAASGAAKTALQNGKIQNKVLKLTGEVQTLQIQERVHRLVRK